MDKNDQIETRRTNIILVIKLSKRYKDKVNERLVGIGVLSITKSHGT